MSGKIVFSYYFSLYRSLHDSQTLRQSFPVLYRVPIHRKLSDRQCLFIEGNRYSLFTCLWAGWGGLGVKIPLANCSCISQLTHYFSTDEVEWPDSVLSIMQALRWKKAQISVKEIQVRSDKPDIDNFGDVWHPCGSVPPAIPLPLVTHDRICGHGIHTLSSSLWGVCTCYKRLYTDVGPLKNQTNSSKLRRQWTRQR